MTTRENLITRPGTVFFKAFGFLEKKAAVDFSNETSGTQIVKNNEHWYVADDGRTFGLNWFLNTEPGEYHFDLGEKPNQDSYNTCILVQGPDVFNHTNGKKVEYFTMWGRSDNKLFRDVYHGTLKNEQGQVKRVFASKSARGVLLANQDENLSVVLFSFRITDRLKERSKHGLTIRIEQKLQLVANSHRQPIYAFAGLFAQAIQKFSSL